MILDFEDSNLPDQFDCDICVIGSGAAALSFLTRFYNTQTKIIVLEAGGEHITERNQELFKINTIDHPFPGSLEGRFRVFGGATMRWGGQALPMDSIDFEKRDWIAHSGWPIAKKELDPYYDKADHFLNLDVIGEYDENIFDLIKEKELPESADLNLRFSKWSPTPNVRELYRQKIQSSKNISLLQNANLTNLHLNENKKTLAQAEFRTYDGRQGKVKARKFVLACGGLENPRLLLTSNNQLEKGLGNHKDMVGRFLQDHPNARVATFQPLKRNTQAYFNYFLIAKTRYLPRLICSNEFQKQEQTVNVGASLLHFTKPEHPFEKIKELYRKKVRGELKLKDASVLFSVMKHLPALTKTAKQYFIDKKIYTPDPDVKLNIMMECNPEPHNRIQLSDEKDIFGMPKIQLHWTISDQVIHTFEKSLDLFKSYIDQSGLGILEKEDFAKNKDWKGRINDATHHIGTTRMGVNDSEAVVDQNCKVFELDNLYIAGSSVFPTGSHSNPTLTIIALAMRLADHLSEKD